MDDFPDAELEEISKNYDFVYFLGVWQTGEFGVKKSIKLLDIDPCMKASTAAARNYMPFSLKSPLWGATDTARNCAELLPEINDHDPFFDLAHPRSTLSLQRVSMRGAGIYLLEIIKISDTNHRQVQKPCQHSAR